MEFSLQHTLSKYSLNGWWIYGAGIDMNDLCRETESFQYVKKNYLNNAGWCIKESLKKSLILHLAPFFSIVTQVLYGYGLLLDSDHTDVWKNEE